MTFSNGFNVYKRTISLLICATLLFMNQVYAYSAYSNEELDELEKEFVQQINQSNSVLRNPLAIEYINHLAKTLARNAHMKSPYFFVVKSNEINAFAGPGGYIGINSQLILATDNESELAAVMAHEMAHVRQHHLYRMIEHQKQMRVPMLASILASAALGVINPTLASGALMASLTGVAQDSINFTRSNEKEADRIGIDMLIKSGLDPKGMAGFFRKIQLSTRYYYMNNIPAILRSHPLDDDRIAEAENRCLHLNKKNYPDHLDYHLFKELVRTSVANDSKQLLDFYQRECRKTNTATACQYGLNLTKMHLRQYQVVLPSLTELQQQIPNSLYLTIALAQAEIGNHQYGAAIQRLQELQANNPDNYAAISALGKGLVEANHASQAVSVLLKGTRLFKQDLSLCYQLAKAQAQAQQKDYAYFTQAQCELMQGRRKGALDQLKQAKRLAQKDKLLQARIDAKIDEIKSLSE